MTIINIGELIKSISEETRLIYKHIPWKAIAGFRDITAHKYQTLHMEDVYNTMKNELKEIEMLLKEILKESGK